MLVGVTQTKIYNFEILEFVQEQILRFDVSMSDAQISQVLNTCNKLLEDPACLFFLQFLFCCYEIKELSIATMLHDQVKLRLCFDDFIKLDNVRMSNDLQYVNFPGDTLHIIDIFNFGLFKDFDSDLYPLRTKEHLTF